MSFYALLTVLSLRMVASFNWILLKASQLSTGCLFFILKRFSYP